MEFKLTAPPQKVQSVWRACPCGRPIARYVTVNGQQMLNTASRCGSCPLRRASDAEIEAYGDKLDRCHRCDSPCIQLTGGVPDFSRSIVVTCLECRKLMQAQCAFPFHAGKRLVSIDMLRSFAWKDNRQRIFNRPNPDNGKTVQITCCLNCASRNRMVEWSEYAAATGKADHATGEVTPAPSVGQSLVLTGDPLAAWGGISKAFWPKRGSTAIGQWVAFVPGKIIRFEHRNSSVRAMTATIYVDATETEHQGRTFSLNVNTVLGTVVHGGIMQFVENMLATKRHSDRYASLPGLGYVFAGIYGAEESGRHRLHLDTFEKAHGEGASLKEWVETCVEITALKIETAMRVAAEQQETTL